MAMINRALFLFLFSLSLFGSEVDNKPFKELVVRYNHGLLLANKKNQFEHMQEYLTQQIYYKTRVYIESYTFANLYMDAHLLGVQFGKFNQDGITATLDTHEKWKYRYIHMKTKKIEWEPTKTEYDLRYFFIQLEDGTWKINHIKILKEVTTPLVGK